VASYTQALAAKANAIIAACSNFEGVAPGYLNALVGSVPGANTARIGTGGAIVDGQWYENGAAVDVNIPSAVGGGNTRIDRIVLRVTWASFQCVITRIAGTDAASPTAPAITQTPGTTYDIMLCQALVNTGGTVTLTDERVFSKVSSANGLGSDVVTTVKILDANVTYAKLAPGASKFTNRQGSVGSNWSDHGSGDFSPTAVKIQGGSAYLTMNAAYNDKTITFPVAFSGKPLVFITIMTVETSPRFVAVITSQSATNVVIRILTVDGSTYSNDIYFRWLAIGPE
jgi:hypothetical protein